MVVRSANGNARGAAAQSGRARPRSVRVVIASLREVRRVLNRAGDIAADVAFQNDVNALLAAVARLPPPETAAAAETEFELAETPAPRRVRGSAAAVSAAASRR